MKPEFNFPMVANRSFKGLHGEGIIRMGQRFKTTRKGRAQYSEPPRAGLRALARDYLGKPSKKKEAQKTKAPKKVAASRENKANRPPENK